MNFSICFSTINQRIFQLEERLHQLHQHPDVLVIHQVTEPFEYSSWYEKFPYVRFITSSAPGLSASRNLGLQHAFKEWVYLADDDLTPVTGWEEIASSAIQQYPEAAVLCFQLLTDKGKPYKPYRGREFVHQKATIGSVSSAEMLVNKKLLIENQIFYNEQFGLGARYISGEEYLLLRDCLRHRLVVRYLPKCIAVHPGEGTGSHYNQALVVSKGALIAASFGHLFWVFNLVYAVRKYPSYRHQISLFRFIRYIYSGSCSYVGIR